MQLLTYNNHLISPPISGPNIDELDDSESTVFGRISAQSRLLSLTLYVLTVLIRCYTYQIHIELMKIRIHAVEHAQNNTSS